MALKAKRISSARNHEKAIRLAVEHLRVNPRGHLTRDEEQAYGIVINDYRRWATNIAKHLLRKTREALKAVANARRAGNIDLEMSAKNQLEEIITRHLYGQDGLRELYLSRQTNNLPNPKKTFCLKTVAQQRTQKFIHNEITRRVFLCAFPSPITNRVLSACYRFAMKISKPYLLYPNYQADLNDIGQYATMGLLETLWRYDYKLGWCFLTSAKNWIKHRIRIDLLNDTFVSFGRLPQRKNDEKNKVAGFIKKFLSHYGRLPTTAEIIQATELSSTRVRSAIRLLRTDKVINFSELDHWVSRRGERERKAQLRLQNDLSPEDLVIAKDLLLKYKRFGENLTALAESWKPKNRELVLAIARNRLLQPRDEAKALKEIGKKFQVTKDWVRQLEKSLISKAQRRLEKSDFAPTYDQIINLGQTIADLEEITS